MGSCIVLEIDLGEQTLQWRRLLWRITFLYLSFHFFLSQQNSLSSSHYTITEGKAENLFIQGAHTETKAYGFSMHPQMKMEPSSSYFISNKKTGQRAEWLSQNCAMVCWRMEAESTSLCSTPMPLSLPEQVAKLKCHEEQLKVITTPHYPVPS